ncbi:MAG: SufE family protein [Saprospiraceae bacterium]|nr:SufE family protein [Saprospiraceae bacterium]
MNHEEKVQRLIEEFEMFDDWMDKYNHIIEMGKTLTPLDEKYKTESNVISGCQSKVWLHAEYIDGKVIFTADSDAIITKGIVGMLIIALSGKTPDEIINDELGFVDDIGIKEHLSPTRSNGLVSMIKQMKLYALVFKTKYES